MPRVAILSRHAELYSTRRLLDAVAAVGAEPVLIQPERCLLLLDEMQAHLYYGSSLVAPCAAVIPRVGGPITRLGSRLLRYFAGAGSRCLNTAESLELSRDKFASLQALVTAGVAVPKTAYFTQMEQRDLAISVLGTPLVHKLLHGSQGVGVHLADTPMVARGMLDTFLHLQHEAMAQRFLGGRQDFRVLVLFGEVIAAMRREASTKDFRSNLHCGGRARALPDLPEEWAAIARRSVAALGLGFAGVDIMLDKDHSPLVLEVNPVPSLEGIERVTGQDIAGRLVKALLDEIPFPSPRPPP